MVYSGFSHFCFWQCSDSRLTGSLPVHEAPPIRVLVSGLLEASAAALLAAPVAVFTAPADPNLAGALDLALVSSLDLPLEFVKTIKLSSVSPCGLGGLGGGFLPIVPVSLCSGL